MKMDEYGMKSTYQEIFAIKYFILLFPFPFIYPGNFHFSSVDLLFSVPPSPSVYKMYHTDHYQPAKKCSFSLVFVSEQKPLIESSYKNRKEPFNNNKSIPTRCDIITKDSNGADGSTSLYT